jgi:hypothetical protein
VPLFEILPPLYATPDVFLSLNDFYSPTIMSLKGDFGCFNIWVNFYGDIRYNDEQLLLLDDPLQIQHKFWIKNSHKFILPYF